MAQDPSTTVPLNVLIAIAQSIATDFEATAFASATAMPTSFSESLASIVTQSSTSMAPSTSIQSATSYPTIRATAGESYGPISPATRDAIIISATVGGVIILGGLALGIWLCLRRRKKRRLAKREQDDSTQDTGSRPPRADDWYHGDLGHHGYVGPPAPGSESRIEMLQLKSQEKKGPKQSILRILNGDSDGHVPDITRHPALASYADPYTAAEVGALAAGVGGAGAVRAAHEPEGQSAGLSTGPRRLSGQMPARKPVGSPPSLSRHRDSNPLRLDTSAAAVGAGVGAATILPRAADSSTASEHQYSPRASQRSLVNRTSNPFVSPPAHMVEPPTTPPRAQRPEPSATSPLSSHPSNQLLCGQTANRRNSCRSQQSVDEPIFDTPVRSTAKPKRPPTPLGFQFDFGLGDEPGAVDPYATTHSEAEPLRSDFEPQTLSAHHPESRPLTPDFQSQAFSLRPLESQPLASDFELQTLHSLPPESRALTSDIEPTFITAYNPRHPSNSNPLISNTTAAPSQPFTAPVSRYSNVERHSGITAPTAAQRASLEGRSRHFLDYTTSPQASEQRLEPSPPIVPEDNREPTIPIIPERSPRRLSRTSFDEPMIPGSVQGHQSPSLASGFATPGEIAIPPRSPKRASWNRSRESVNAHPQSQSPRAPFRDPSDFVHQSPRSPYGHASSPRHSPRIGPALGHRSEPRARSNTDIPGPHSQTGSLYTPTRSQAFGRAPGYPVYGPSEPGAASSVESWVSARAVPVPTPWEDNAIRRNSSSGNLRRPELQRQHRRSSSSPERLIEQSDPRGIEESPKEGEITMQDLRSQGQADSGYYSGPGGFDSSWGESSVEEPVFERYGAQHSRRRSVDRGAFDPRYGRWTDETFEEMFGDKSGVGKAL